MTSISTLNSLVATALIKCKLNEALDAEKVITDIAKMYFHSLTLSELQFLTQEVNHLYICQREFISTIFFRTKVYPIIVDGAFELNLVKNIILRMKRYKKEYSILEEIDVLLIKNELDQAVEEANKLWLTETKSRAWRKITETFLYVHGFEVGSKLIENNLDIQKKSDFTSALVEIKNKVNNVNFTYFLKLLSKKNYSLEKSLLSIKPKLQELSYTLLEVINKQMIHTSNAHLIADKDIITQEIRASIGLKDDAVIESYDDLFSKLIRKIIVNKRIAEARNMVSRNYIHAAWIIITEINENDHFCAQDLLTFSFIVRSMLAKGLHDRALSIFNLIPPGIFRERLRQELNNRTKNN